MVRVKYGTLHLDIADCVKEILERTKGKVNLAIPLGVGKPIHFVNSIYQEAQKDSNIRLNIFTALSFNKPRPRHELQRRFLDKTASKLFGIQPRLLYVDNVESDSVPNNVSIFEFFANPGSIRGKARSQRNFIYANYSEVFKVLSSLEINVVAQAISPHSNGENFSLGLNTDISSDLFASSKWDNVFFVGEVCEDMPYFSGVAQLSRSNFDYIVTPSEPYDLFSIPQRPVADEDFLIGIYASTLIRDGGTIQIGIGSLGDAVAYALILRHENNKEYLDVLRAFFVLERYGGLIYEIGGTSPFEKGLYACSEMLNDPLVALLKKDIIKRMTDSSERRAKVHAAFGAGSREFLKYVKVLQSEDVSMESVRFTNTILNDESVNDRRDARFCNSAMSVNILGGTTSDTLPSGTIISGVGGQLDFVLQSRNLPGARSIILLRSTHSSRGKTASTISWESGFETTPRSLKDLVITEYGIADLRYQSDGEVAAQLIGISDARFAGKLSGMVREKFSDLIIESCENHKESISSGLAVFKKKKLFPKFPLGSSLSQNELHLMLALESLKKVSLSKRKMFLLLVKSIIHSNRSEVEDVLGLVGLSKAKTFREKTWRALLSVLIDLQFQLDQELLPAHSVYE